MSHVNTGHRDARGRAIHRGPRGGLYVHTEDGGRGRPSFGRQTNRATRADLAEAHAFYRSGGHPSRNLLPRRQSAAPGPRHAAAAPGHLHASGDVVVVPAGPAEIRASLPARPEYCDVEPPRKVPRTWVGIDPGLGPLCRLLTNDLLLRLLADNGGKVGLHVIVAEGGEELCPRHMEKVTVSRVPRRSDLVEVLWHKAGDDDGSQSDLRTDARVRRGRRATLGGGDQWVWAFVKEVDRGAAARRIQAAVRGHQERKRHAARLEEAYAPGGRGFQLARDRFHAGTHVR